MRIVSHVRGIVCSVSVVAALFLASSSYAGPCDCQDTDSDGFPDVGTPCSVTAPVTLSYTSGVNGNVPSDTISTTVEDIDGDGLISCGMYASGDYWVEGEGSPKRGKVSATNPAPSSGNNGWMVNPVLNSNGLDSEIGGYVAPPAFPQEFETATGPVSFVFAKSATVKDGTPKQLESYGCYSPTQDSRSCLQLVTAVTFVDSAPIDSHELFRPEIYGAGANKTTDLRISDIAPQVAALPSLAIPSGVNPPSLASIAKHGRWPAIGYHSNQKQKDVQQWMARGNYGEDYCPEPSSYGLSHGCTEAAVFQRFSMLDFDRSIPAGSMSRRAMVAYVQKSCDALAGLRVGGAFGPPLSQQTGVNAWGNIFHGRILMPFACAYLSGRAVLREDFQNAREAGRFIEAQLFNYGPADAPYQGWSSAETPVCSNPVNNCTAGTKQESDCLPAAQNRDAGCCSGVKTYPQRSAVMLSHTAAAVLIWDRYATGGHDPSAVFDYDRLLKFGLGFGRLATSRAGVISGMKCSGSGGSLPDGIVPTNSSSGHSPLLDAMYDTYVGEFQLASLGGDTSTPPPPPAEEPPPVDEPADPPVIVAFNHYDAVTEPPTFLQLDWQGGTYTPVSTHGFQVIVSGDPAAIKYYFDGVEFRQEINSPFGCSEGPGGTWIPCPELFALAPGNHTLRVVAVDEDSVEVPDSAKEIPINIPAPPPTVQVPVITIDFPTVTVTCLAEGNRVNFVRVRKASTTLYGETLPSTPSVQTHVVDLTPLEAVIAGAASADQADNITAQCRLGSNGETAQAPAVLFDAVAAFASLGEPPTPPDPQCPTCPSCLTAADLQIVVNPTAVSCPALPAPVCMSPVVNPTPVTCPELPAPICLAPDNSLILDRIQAVEDALTDPARTLGPAEVLQLIDSAKQAVKDALREGTNP